MKPIYRRALDQQAAHAIFTFKDVDLANICIRDVRPSRLKHEPIQCMKCRKWGHFAYACSASVDTCSTCGEEHKTSVCSTKDKTYCVSCRSNVHASWSRDCLEFRRRCDQYDENYPENILPYFPSEESWTLIPRPDRLQHSERFPVKYTVASLQHPTRTEHANPARTQNRQRKNQAGSVPANQHTMERFIAPRNSQNNKDKGTDTPPENADTAAPTDSTFYSINSFHHKVGAEPHPQGWD